MVDGEIVKAMIEKESYGRNTTRYESERVVLGTWKIEYFGLGNARKKTM